MTRTINNHGLALIKKYEGCVLHSYYDAVGVLTIGYGSTGAHVKPKMHITQTEADKLLKDDLERFELCVEQLVDVPLTDNQYAALVSFSFNLGCGSLKSSTLLKKLNSRDYAGASREFSRWNKAGGRVLLGLTRRRASEAWLFNLKQTSG